MKAHKMLFGADGQALPIRMAVQDIYRHYLQEVVQYSKVYKPTLGQDLRQAISTLRNEVNRAAKLHHKQTALRDADVALENLRDVLWAAYEVKCVSEGQLGIWVEKMNAVGRMLGGWIKKENGKHESHGK